MTNEIVIRMNKPKQKGQGHFKYTILSNRSPALANLKNNHL